MADGPQRLVRSRVRLALAVPALLLGMALGAAATQAGTSAPARVAIDSTSLDLLQCPTTTQCTALESGADQRSKVPLHEVTFNPLTPSLRRSQTIDRGNRYGWLTGLSCPTATECVATDQTGIEITFNPQASTRTNPHVLTRAGAHLRRLGGVTCLTSQRCLASGLYSVFAFNPQVRRQPLALRPGGYYTSVLTCWSASRCLGIGVTSLDPDANAPSLLVMFDPLHPKARPEIAPLPVPPEAAAAAPGGIVCPTLKSCVEIFTEMLQTGNPDSPVEQDGAVWAFSPLSPGTPTLTTIDTGHEPLDLACPTAHQCIAVDVAGQMVTFDPSAPSAASNAVLSPLDNASSADPDRATFEALTCPSLRECVSIDSRGYEITFNPVTGTTTG